MISILLFLFSFQVMNILVQSALQDNRKKCDNMEYKECAYQTIYDFF